MPRERLCLQVGSHKVGDGHAMSFGTANNHLVDGKGKEEIRRLSTAHLLAQVLRTDPSLEWQMTPSEQVMVMHLVEHLKPKAAIEIGTRFGGSLQVLAKFCDRVYSLDIDPEVQDRLKGRFENVEYLIGPSDETLLPLLDRLPREYRGRLYTGRWRSQHRGCTQGPAQSSALRAFNVYLHHHS